MTLRRPGAIGALANGAGRQPRPYPGLDRLASDRARTKERGPCIETGNDRRFEPVTAGAAVENPVDPAVEIGKDMRGRGRADPA